MSNAVLMAACINCGQTFFANPELVVSVRINGRREPVCKRCVMRVNAQKREVGLPEFTIPKGAYY